MSFRSPLSYKAYGGFTASAVKKTYAALYRDGDTRYNKACMKETMVPSPDAYRIFYHAASCESFI